MSHLGIRMQKSPQASVTTLPISSETHSGSRKPHDHGQSGGKNQSQ